MKFTFTDKSSYLAWRQEWKTNYAQLTAEIRAQKRARKQFLRTYRVYQTPQGKARELVTKIPNPEFGNCSRPGLRFEAATQMEILAEAKALSWALKQGQPAAVPETVPEPITVMPVAASSLASRAVSALRTVFTA